WVFEVNIFWKWVGLRFEMVGQTIDLAQYNDTNPANATLARTAVGAVRGQGPAQLDGLGYYIEAYGWILGDVNFLETPGIEAAPRLKRFSVAKEPRWGLMLAAKYEHVAFDVTGLPAQADGSLDPAQGHYSIDVFELGLNAWA